MEKIEKNAVIQAILKSGIDANHYSLLKGMINALPTTTDEWVSVETPPKESGRYWCNVKEINDLGNSCFQWNCYYDAKVNDWTDNFNPYTVTHWTNLLPQPLTK